MSARIVVAGTRSGVGKTSVAVGLMAALAARGHAVSGHKVGPDFIDGSYHALATGHPPRNLDAFLVGADLIAPLFAHGARGADLAIVEGVMGLFDGRGSGDEASTAHVARLLAAPVVLVVDAAAASRSVAAEVHGFATFDPTVAVAGVVVNRVGSPRHAELVRDAVAALGLPVLGAIPEDPALATPSRHLGLVPAAERPAAARATVAALAAAVAAHVDLDAVVALARSAPPLTVAAWQPPPARAPAGVVAVAAGPAFTFSYTEHVELLAAAGAEVATLDPTRDEALPAGTTALYLGGGFPETYGDALVANRPLRAAIARFPGPVVAECGGLLYLCRTLEGRPMCGLIDADATFTPGLTLAYHDALSASDTPLAPAGTHLRAHEFHRTTVTPAAGSRPAWRLAGGRVEGFAGPRLHASYLHPHWAATPQVAARLAAGEGVVA